MEPSRADHVRHRRPRLPRAALALKSFYGGRATSISERVCGATAKARHVSDRRVRFGLLDQVGKNVGTCLKVAGATVNDIAFTITSVSAPAEFEKHADLLPRYFGPPSPESKTVPTAQLSNPDFLLQVEAFAAIK